MSNRQFQHNMSNLRGLFLSMTSSRLVIFYQSLIRYFHKTSSSRVRFENAVAGANKLSSSSFFLPELCPHVRQCTCALLHNGLQHPVYLVCNKREYLAHNHPYAIPMLMRDTNCHIIHRRKLRVLKNNTKILKNCKFSSRLRGFNSLCSFKLL